MSVLCYLISNNTVDYFSVAYVSRSGGMSNELNNIIGQNTDGVYEGVAIGGDRYPGSTYLSHLLRYEADDRVKMMVMLGEVIRILIARLTPVQYCKTSN